MTNKLLIFTVLCLAVLISAAFILGVLYQALYQPLPQITTPQQTYNPPAQANSTLPRLITATYKIAGNVLTNETINCYNMTKTGTGYNYTPTMNCTP